jgi:tetratricopeptide (TPR) repeat protein/transcriptional regulator with XRE-family HTH domain
MLLRRLRTAAGLTQEELAEAAALSARSISDLERGINQTARKDTARLLADALGLEDETRRAFEAAARGRTPVPGPRAATATRTLPRDIASFTGREVELARLLEAAVGAASRGSVIGIHAIGGMAGIGKTTLAVHAAHRLADRFPDGQFFLPLHAHTPGQPPVDPADALASLLLAAGVPPGQIPDGMEARMARWRGHLAGKLLLLVLDDASGHEQVRPLLPSSGGSMVLVTSRKHLTALDDATAISLDILTPEEAGLLLVGLADRRGLLPDDPAVARITQLCGYLPLAIGMLGRQLYHHPAWTAADLAQDLAEARDRLELMRTENLSVAVAFDLSYAELPPDRQLLFRRLGLSPGQDADAYAAAALTGGSLAQARRELGELYDHHLLAEPARGRYRLHDLLREHARALVTADPDAENDAAVGRLMAYYLHTARLANAHLASYARPVTGGANGAPDAADEPSEHPGLLDRGQAQAWFSAERDNLLGSISHATARQDGPVIIGLTDALAVCLRRQGPWTQALDLHAAAVSAARRSGDRLAEANARTELGAVRQLTGDYAGATEALALALGIYRELGDRLGQANAQLEVGNVQRLRSDYSGAAEVTKQALDLYREVNEPRGQAAAFHQLGRILCVTNDFQGATVALEQAITLSRYLHDAVSESAALAQLGVVRYATDDFSGAISALEQSLELSQDSGDRFGQGFPLLQLGVVRYTVDDYPGAMSALERALEIYDEFGNMIGIANVWCNIGTVRRLTGDYQESVGASERALDIYRDLGHRLGAGHALHNLGAVRYLTGDLPAATDLMTQAIGIYRELGHKYGEGDILADLGVVNRLGGNYRDAARLLNQALATCRELDNQMTEAEVLNYVGDLQRGQEDASAALDSHRRALELARLIGTPRVEAQSLAGLGRSELALGRDGPGAAALRQALEIYQRIGAAEARKLAAELDAVADLGFGTGRAPARAGGLVASADDGDHAEQRGERDDQGDEVGGGEVAQGVESPGEADDQDGDDDQAPSVQEQAQRERRRGRGHVGHGGDGLRLAALGETFADPDVEHQVAGPVGDEEQFVGMGGIGCLGHRAPARGPGHRRPDGGRPDAVTDLLADDHGFRALDDQLRGPGGRGSPAGLAAVAGVASRGPLSLLAGLGLPGPDRFQGLLHRGEGGLGTGVPVERLLWCGRLPGQDELAADQQLGEPDLPGVHAPGHGHHRSGESRGPKPEHGGDGGLAGTSGSGGGEHVVSLIGPVAAE